MLALDGAAAVGAGRSHVRRPDRCTPRGASGPTARRRSSAVDRRPARPISRLTDRQLAGVQDLLRSRLGEPVPLADMAAVAGLSVSQVRPPVQGPRRRRTPRVSAAPASRRGAPDAGVGPVADRRRGDAVRVLPPGAPHPRVTHPARHHAGGDSAGAPVRLTTAYAFRAAGGTIVQDSGGPPPRYWWKGLAGIRRRSDETGRGPR